MHWASCYSDAFRLSLDRVPLGQRGGALPAVADQQHKML